MGQASLLIWAVSPEPSLFTYMKYWNRTRGLPKNQTSSPTGWLRMHVWRMSLRKTKSTIISWAGSIYLFFTLVSFRGFQAYLAGSPNYNFPLYRQLVHEITQTFSKISRDILSIKSQLCDRCSLTGLSSVLEKIQDKEKEKLELVIFNEVAKLKDFFSSVYEP